MIKWFLSAWILYWSGVLLLPVYSIYAQAIATFTFQLLFLCMILFGYTLSKIINVRPSSYVNKIYQPNSQVIYYLLALAVIGTIFLFLDKLLVKGLDYSKGLLAAGNEWRHSEENSSGVSSFYTLLGYPLAVLFIPAMIILFRMKENGAKNLRSAIILIILLALFNAILTGGRSVILLTIGYAIASWNTYSAIPNKQNVKTKKVKLILVSTFAGIGFLYYISYIFVSRAMLSDIKPSHYIGKMLGYLGLEIYPWFEAFINSGPFGLLLGLLVLTASYITHSFATFSGLINAENHGETILFLMPLQQLAKFNIVAAPNGEWPLAGRFPSLPGALYYQFGVWGMIIISFFTGFVAGLSNTLTRAFRHSILLQLFRDTLFITLLFSPFLFAIDFMHAPIVIFSTIILHYVLRIRIKEKM
ncbi:hypothetical protein [Kangiella marina]|uniref:Oligosaccharide repeat unit polymerase n=1 Tax=Kangiella marina TaxID=1079178 RepID=A0ABP8INY4_9GAMM